MFGIQLSDLYFLIFLQLSPQDCRHQLKVSSVTGQDLWCCSARAQHSWRNNAKSIGIIMENMKSSYENCRLLRHKKLYHMWGWQREVFWGEYSPWRNQSWQFIKGIKQDKLGKVNRATELPLSGQVWDTMAHVVVASWVILPHPCQPRAFSVPDYLSFISLPLSSGGARGGHEATESDPQPRLQRWKLLHKLPIFCAFVSWRCQNSGQDQ